MRASAESIRRLKDFSSSLPPDYRAGYACWRRGYASGAKGEPARVLKPVKQPTPDDPWAESWSPEMRRESIKPPAPLLRYYSAEGVSAPSSPSCGPTPNDPWDEAPFALGGAALISPTPPSSAGCSPRSKVTAATIRSLPEFSSVPASYRDGYARWRSGEAVGAKGEP